MPTALTINWYRKKKKKKKKLSEVIHTSVDGDQVSDDVPCTDLADFGINVNRVNQDTTQDKNSYGRNLIDVYM